MPGGKGRPNKKIGSNSQHHDSLSQSGQQRRQVSKPQRGNGGKSGGGPSLGDMLFGKGSVQWGHGGSKKNRNKGKGSR